MTIQPLRKNLDTAIRCYTVDNHLPLCNSKWWVACGFYISCICSVLRSSVVVCTILMVWEWDDYNGYTPIPYWILMVQEWDNYNGYTPILALIYGMAKNTNSSGLIRMRHCIAMIMVTTSSRSTHSTFPRKGLKSVVKLLLPRQHWGMLPLSLLYSDVA